MRLANYVRTLRRDLLKVSEAVGVVHPGLIGPDDVDILDGGHERRRRCATSTATSRAGACVGRELAEEITALMAPQVDRHPPTRRG